MIATALIAFGALAVPGQTAALSLLTGAAPDALHLTVYETASGKSRVLDTYAADGPPVPSPDGAWIAYPVRDGDRRVIRLIRPDGSEGHTVPHGGTWHDDPVWSPDGKRLAYTVNASFGEKRVAVYSLSRDDEALWGGDEGLGLMNPAFLPLRTIASIAGAFQSPDVASKLKKSWPEFDIAAITGEVTGGGMIIAARAVRHGDRMSTDVALVTAKRVLPPVLDSILPHKGMYEEWGALPSPDGKTIVFESNDGGDRELYLLSFKKSVYNLTNHYEADWNPVWEPDSRYILFESFREGRRGIYQVLADTVRVSPIAVTSDGDNWAPACSPDGGQVAFVSNRTGVPALWFADADGANARLVDTGAAIALAPAWIPEAAE